MTEYVIGQKIAFYCGGRGRGGHVAAFSEVVKINKKSVTLKELPMSYGAGHLWRCNKEWLEDNLISRGMCPSGFNGY